MLQTSSFAMPITKPLYRNLPEAYIDQAFSSLDHDPVVLGPTADGGYYLVGARGQVPPIFDDIQWSTGSVWDQTVARLREHDRPFATLPAWYDVDELPDLLRLARDLENGQGSDPLVALQSVVARLLDSVGERPAT